MIYKIILFICISYIIFFISHLLITRGIKKVVSHQKALIMLALFYNFPIVLFSSILFKDWTIILYIFFMINGFTYFYFHFFNMSETARGIKIVVNIKTGKIKNIADIKNIYTMENSLVDRLKRLEHLKQIEKKSEENYLLKGKSMYFAASIIVFFRKILGMKI
jgi:hypothetical protein